MMGSVRDAPNDKRPDGETDFSLSACRDYSGFVLKEILHAGGDVMAPACPIMPPRLEIREARGLAVAGFDWAVRLLIHGG